MNQQILRIDASMRVKDSTSRMLADKLVAKLTPNTQSNVLYRDLADGIPFVNEEWINANFTDPSLRSDEQKRVLAVSDELVSEVKGADTLVIATPIYNFGVPAAFKAWIDMIARARETFKYTEHGPKGLLDGKKAYVIITSGGTQLGSDIDFVSMWMKHVLSFIGIDDVTFIDSSGLMKGEEETIERAHSEIAAVA